MDEWDQELLEEQRLHEQTLLRGKTWATKLNHQFTWHDAEGNRWQILEMDADHRSNTINWLRRNARRIKLLVEYAWAEQHLPGPFPGDGTQVDAVEWMRSTPFFQALVTVQLAQHAADQSADKE